MFITSEDGLHMQDIQSCSHNCESLLSCAVPYLFFIRKVSSYNKY